MNSATQGSAGDRGDDRTPGSDIQPDDAGTPASGNSGRGTAAEGAMKQTAKTDAESGTRGPAGAEDTDRPGPTENGRA